MTSQPISDSSISTQCKVVKALSHGYFVPKFLHGTEFSDPMPQRLIEMHLAGNDVGKRSLELRFPCVTRESIPIELDTMVISPLFGANKIGFTNDVDPADPRQSRYTISVPEAQWDTFSTALMKCMDVVRTKKDGKALDVSPAAPAIDPAATPAPNVDASGLSYDHKILGCGLEQTRF